MPILILEPGAIADLEVVWATDAPAAATLMVLLEEVENGVQALRLVLDNRLPAERPKRTKMEPAAAVLSRLCTLTCRPAAWAGGTSAYRVLHLQDPRHGSHHVMAVCHDQAGEASWNAIGSRIHTNYLELGFSLTTSSPAPDLLQPATASSPSQPPRENALCNPASKGRRVGDLLRQFCIDPARRYQAACARRRMAAELARQLGYQDMLGLRLAAGLSRSQLAAALSRPVQDIAMAETAPATVVVPRNAGRWARALQTDAQTVLDAALRTGTNAPFPMVEARLPTSPRVDDEADKPYRPIVVPDSLASRGAYSAYCTFIQYHVSCIHEATSTYGPRPSPPGISNRRNAASPLAFVAH